MRLRALALTALALSSSAAFAQASIQSLGGFRPTGVSNDGRVVSGDRSVPSPGLLEAVRWTEGGGITPLPGFPGPTVWDRALAVSADGDVLVGYSYGYDGPGFDPTRWVEGAGPDYLGALNTDPAVQVDAEALAVSADGRVIVGYAEVPTPEYTGSGPRAVEQAFRWEGGSMSGLGYLASFGERTYSRATGVSSDGSVVVGYSSSGSLAGCSDPLGCREAVRWEGGQMQGLGAIGSGRETFSYALAVSADGRVVVGKSSSPSVQYGEAAVWADGTIRGLGTLPGDVESVALAVSADGSLVVGESIDLSGDETVFLWTAATGMRALRSALLGQGVDLSGWTLERVGGLSANGNYLVGFDGSGSSVQGWLVELDAPEALVVNDTRDLADLDTSDGRCDAVDDTDESGDQCTLRAAIEEANERGGAEIVFDIDAEGTPTIHVTEYSESEIAGDLLMQSLPPIKADVTIDGTTQAGGWVEISLDGSDDGGTFADAIRVAAGGAGSTLRGLVINRYRGSGIRLLPGADGCVIEGNRVGTDVGGTQRLGFAPLFFFYSSNEHGLSISLDSENFRNGSGAGIRAGSHDNVIQDNVVAGNARVLDDGSQNGGIDILIDRFTRGNVIRRNRIGVGPAGSLVLSEADLQAAYVGSDDFGVTLHRYVGIVLRGSEHTVGGGPDDGNVIGGHNTEILALAPARNRISGNTVRSLSDYAFHDALWLAGSGSDILEPDAPSGRGTVEQNDIQTHAKAAYVWGGWDVRENVLHGLSDAWTEPPNDQCNHTFHQEFAVDIPGGDVLFEGNTVRSNSWAILASGDGSRLVENTILDAWGGVRVWAGGRVALTRNEIRTRNIGIDLVDGMEFQCHDGVTANDVTDSDAGPNELLNYPVPLQTSRSGSTLAVEGILWGAFSGTTTVEAFANTFCSNAGFSRLPFGAGQVYLGAVEVDASVGDAGEPPFTLVADGFDPAYNYVTFTATRTDLGITSEFSRCIQVAEASRTARVDVDAGQTGELLAAQDVVIEAAEAGTGRRAPHDGGTLYVARYEQAPAPSLFAEATATSTDGSAVRPDAVAPAYWSLTDRGLTPEGGAEAAALRFRVCLGSRGRVLDGQEGKVVLVQRSLSTGGAWVPWDTDAEERAGETYLCADGLDGLGEFSLGGSESAFPVSEEGDRVADRAALAVTIAPNPSTGTTTVRLDLREPGPARVEVLDALGRRVAVVHDGPLAAGTHTLSPRLDGLPAGVYVVRVVTATATASRALTVVR